MPTFPVPHACEPGPGNDHVEEHRQGWQEQYRAYQEIGFTAIVHPPAYKGLSSFQIFPKKSELLNQAWGFFVFRGEETTKDTIKGRKIAHAWVLVARTTRCPGARSAQEAMAFFPRIIRSKLRPPLPVAFGHPDNERVVRATRIHLRASFPTAQRDHHVRPTEAAGIAQRRPWGKIDRLR